MDIVQFWSQQVAKWNEINKCGFCWEFGAPLVNSQINIQQSNDPCCIQLLLSNIRYRSTKNRNPISQLITNEDCTWTFTLHAVTEKPLGINNYNEIKGHSVDESKWNTIFAPLLECLGCESIIDYCEILGYDVIVNQIGDAELIHNYLDNNYNGWKITYSFTLKK